MSQEEDVKRDEGLSSILRRWRTPARPDRLDARVMASFRAQTRPSFWRAFFATSVRVPLPIALAVVLVAIVSTALLMRQPPPAVAAPDADPGGPAIADVDLTQFQPPDEIKVTILSRGGER